MNELTKKSATYRQTTKMEFNNNKTVSMRNGERKMVACLIFMVFLNTLRFGSGYMCRKLWKIIFYDNGMLAYFAIIAWSVDTGHTKKAHYFMP